MKLDPKDERLLNKDEVTERVKFVAQHFARLEKSGHFPGRANLGRSRVGWYLSEVLAWMDDRKKERDLGLPLYSIASWKIPPQYSNTPPKP